MYGRRFDEDGVDIVLFQEREVMCVCLVEEEWVEQGDFVRCSEGVAEDMDVY